MISSLQPLGGTVGHILPPELFLSELLSQTAREAVGTLLALPGVEQERDHPGEVFSASISAILLPYL